MTEHEHTLIPQPDPERRILIHHRPNETPYCTVESMDRDVTGAPQWRLDFNSQCDSLPNPVVLSILNHKRPDTISPGVHVIGVRNGTSDVLRFSVRTEGDGASLIVEKRGMDMASAPRWSCVHTSFMGHGNCRYDDELIEVLSRAE